MKKLLVALIASVFLVACDTETKNVSESAKEQKSDGIQQQNKQMDGNTASKENVQESQPENELMHRRFELIKFNDKDISTDNNSGRVATLEFNENMRISGKMCNNFMGQTTYVDGILSAKSLAGTRMLCDDETFNQLDILLPEMLKAGAKVSFENNILTLVSDKNTLVYRVKDLVN